jgi:hypothetical protein
MPSLPWTELVRISRARELIIIHLTGGRHSIRGLFNWEDGTMFKFVNNHFAGQTIRDLQQALDTTE